ncbi:MAG TPA: hypothetical protein VND87_02020 [Stellaceae bacterium]|nr:hypothetical protein [Stellaceae bacterium]
MTTMIAELYDTLLAAGTPDDKARKAAEAMTGFDAYDQRFTRVEADIAELKHGVANLDRRVSELASEFLLLKWMVGFALAFLVAITIKLFIP